MKRRHTARLVTAFIGCCVLVVGCGPSPDPDDVAVFRGGEVSFSEAERVAKNMADPDRIASGDDVVDLYREAAESIALRKIATAELDGEDPTAVFPAEVADEILRRIVSRLFVISRLGEELAVSDAEIADYYQQHPSEFTRDDSVLLSMIYLRYSAERPRELSLEALSELRRRALAGEIFERLAAEFSDSESRAQGGMLGWIARGELDPELEEQLFSMREDVICTPLEIPGGAAIFKISDAVNARTFTLEEVTPQIRTRLQRQKMDAAASRLTPEAVEEQGPMDELELAQRLSAADPSTTILESRDRRVSAAEFKSVLEVLTGRPMKELTQAEVHGFFLSMTGAEGLYLAAVDSGLLGEDGVAERIEEERRKVVSRIALDLFMTARMEKELDRRGGELVRFFADNRQRYQSPLRLRVRSLSVAPGAIPFLTARELESFCAEVGEGRASFDDAVDRLGAEIDDRGWLDFRQIRNLDPKVSTLLLGMKAPGFSTPFHLAGRIVVLEVLQIAEPAPLAYENCIDTVRGDYLERNRQSIYRQVATEVLHARRFTFMPTVVRERVLLDAVRTAPPATAG